MMRVFLGGEGVDELGRFAHAPAYAVQSVRGRFDHLPDDAGSLHRWIDRFRSVSEQSIS